MTSDYYYISATAFIKYKTVYCHLS